MPSDMVLAYVTIQGTRPLLFHQFNLDVLSNRPRGGTPGDNPEEWHSTYRCTNDGQFYLDPSYVFASIRDGGTYRQIGRKNLKDRVAATLQVTTDKVLITNRVMPDTLTTNPEEPVYLDIRSVRIGKAAHIRYRVALSAGWEASFQITWDRGFLDAKLMHAITLEAGQFIGIGDGRKIGFGKYLVKQFEVDTFADASLTTA